MPLLVKILQGVLGILLVFTSALAAPLYEEDIELVTSTGTLRGTLTSPAPALPVVGAKRKSVSAPHPLVVLVIAGSGPTDRDGNGPGFHPDNLRQLAHALAGVGHAVVRYDKRGVGASIAATRSESDLRFTDFVDDASRWSESLERDPRFSGVVLLGHSEGALIAAQASAQVHPSGFISVGGVSAPAGEILRRQLNGKLPPDLALRNEEILKGLELGQSSSVVPDPLLTLYRPSVQPYLISWLRVNPIQEYARLSDVPALIVQGETDLQVGVENARALHKALPTSALALIPNMNHVFKEVSWDEVTQVASYTDPTVPLARALVPALDRFLKRLPARSPSTAPSSPR